VTVPALPGLVTQGDTVVQCYERVKEAIALHVAAMAADGEPIPRSKRSPCRIRSRSWWHDAWRPLNRWHPGRSR
jgi:predicted RNase H-like HicB family nuclease